MMVLVQSRRIGPFSFGESIAMQSGRNVKPGAARFPKQRRTTEAASHAARGLNGPIVSMSSSRNSHARTTSLHPRGRRLYAEHALERLPRGHDLVERTRRAIG